MTLAVRRLRREGERRRKMVMVSGRGPGTTAVRSGERGDWTSDSDASTVGWRQRMEDRIGAMSDWNG